MRVWDIHPKHLCRKHLLAEHRELHGLWNILTKHIRKGPSYASSSVQGFGRPRKLRKGIGYSRHPETLRWVGKTLALYNRHEDLVKEFARRGYRHLTPLDRNLAVGRGNQAVFINTVAEQKKILHDKPCECFLEKHKSKNDK